eukprot:TRINITY_DN728_c0_g1_i1.p1 TRINITY_DN728_c0_g1~~TRINITY_DN728_c0_g1_i1.p1  ORF type:complete len:721 (-),score=143.90 TRINITY_DN728_c0_g1_i1:2567-4729(-)
MEPTQMASKPKKKKYSEEFPLHTAANEGDLDRLKKLISERDPSCVNSLDAHLSTPLHLAAHQGHLEIVKYILQLKQAGVRVCKPNLTDVFQRTALYLACSAARYEIVKLLIGLNKSLTSSKRQLIVDIDLQDTNGRTPLINCIRKGYIDLLKLLLENGADPNIQDDALQSALHHACMRAKSSLVAEAVECIKHLMKCNADINLKDVHGFTPLHVCAINNAKSLAEAILEPPGDKKWNPRLLSNVGLTALQLAEKERNLELATFLRDKQAQWLLTTLRQRPMSNWPQLDVADWIEAIGFRQYRDLFWKNNIDGNALLRLDAESLKRDIGITSFGHREQIASKINEFSCAPLPQSSTAIDGRDVDSVESLLRQGKQWEINAADLLVGDVIGKGFFGEVRRGAWKGVDVAVKSIYRNLGTDKEKQRFYKEVLILSQLRHPNIITLFGFVRKDDGAIMMVTELMTGGTLHYLRSNNFTVLDRLRGRVIQDLIRGMVYLHSRTPPVLHRDLNTKNLLLDDHWTTKLGDFGLSRVKDDVNKMTSNVGFLANIAPEVFKGEKYSEKADVFSFAMILYELFTGREPHEGVDILKYANLVSHEDYRPPFPGDPTLQAQAQEQAFAQGNQPFSFVDSAGKPNFHSLVIHPDWKQLIEDCWAQNPEKRPSFSEISSRVNGMVQRKVPSTTKPPTPAAAVAPVNQSTSTNPTPPKTDKPPSPAQLHTSGYIT